MESKLTFEVGNHYWTRDKHKATIWLIRPTYMVGEIDGREDDNPFRWDLGGWWHPDRVPYSCDLVAEWREPRKVMAYAYRNTLTGSVIVHTLPCLGCDWELIAQREIVEGEGME